MVIILPFNPVAHIGIADHSDGHMLFVLAGRGLETRWNKANIVKHWDSEITTWTENFWQNHGHKWKTAGSLRRFPNCRRRFSNEFLPKGFVIDAWKAKDGKSFISSWTQRRVTQVGTKSTLFTRRITCFCRRRSSPHEKTKNHGTILKPYYFYLNHGICRILFSHISSYCISIVFLHFMVLARKVRIHKTQALHNYLGGFDKWINPAWTQCAVTVGEKLWCLRDALKHAKSFMTCAKYNTCIRTYVYIHIICTHKYWHSCQRIYWYEMSRKRRTQSDECYWVW